ncbi:F0F1 ATP synthase subunit epsilon [Ectothiorhodospiraceae bacterium BW-2]|nr:F0F1 ATP synthase subunit epsilon [Ectothiorhodospiraceae bacterium BW-2]
MGMTMHVHIASVEEEIFSGTVEQVHAPGEMGELGIFPRHTQLLTRIKPGEVRVHKEGGGIESFFVSGGILEVQPHVVTLLADTALRARDVDEAEARAAMERASKLLEERSKHPQIELAQAQAELAEASAKIQISKNLREKLRGNRT